MLVDGHVRYGIQVPGGASLLAGYSTATEIRGLDAIPPELRPKERLVSTVHLAFDVMVGTGFALLGLAAWFGLAWWRRRDLPRSRWFLRGASVAGIAAIVSLEAGWVVTEVGRQPWTVRGLLLTRDAVTRSGNVWLFFGGTLVIYTGLAIGTVLALRSLQTRWRAGAETEHVPYGPGDRRAPAPVGATDGG